MDLEALESKLARLDGVEAVRVVGTDSRLEEIHVLARTNKPAKQVVRDVQSLAAAAFGIDVDRRIVSVVQLADNDLSGGDRPVIVDVVETTDGSRSSVRVTLQWHDEMLTGETTGAASVTRNRLVAEAVWLRSARRCRRRLVRSGLRGRTHARLAACAVARILVTSQGRLMVGSALVDDDGSRAVVRAVLDALNRVVPGLRR